MNLERKPISHSLYVCHIKFFCEIGVRAIQERLNLPDEKDRENPDKNINNPERDIRQPYRKGDRRN